jgi:putative tryptophan/tyrosine transport system substrate-binding protein
VILAATTVAASAIQRETRTIPIIFVAVSDPVGAGLVPNLARPDANITGLLSFEDSLAGKWLGMLKEIAPPLERIALVADPKTSPFDYFVRVARMVAPSLGVEVMSSPVESGIDIEKAIASLGGTMNGGLVLTPDTTTITHRDLIIALAARHRIPAVYFDKGFVSAGGLMSYGIDFAVHIGQAATYVDRILRGANPSDLPVQAPKKFEAAINLKTAKELGLTVPSILLATADEVIE